MLLYSEYFSKKKLLKRNSTKIDPEIGEVYALTNSEQHSTPSDLVIIAVMALATVGAMLVILSGVFAGVLSFPVLAWTFGIAGIIGIALGFGIGALYYFNRKNLAPWFESLHKMKFPQEKIYVDCRFASDPIEIFTNVSGKVISVEKKQLIM